MKWYPADWRADPLVRACSPVARYVWMECLGLMHEAKPYGHLLINGKPMPPEVLANQIAMDVGEVVSALAELEANGVFSRKRNGIIFSRRMERDEIKRSKNREIGKLGGNPSLKKQKEKPASVNPSDNGEVKTQRPETRNQKPEREREPATPEHRAQAQDALARGKAVLTDWEKQFLGSLLTCRTLSRSQREKFSAILQGLNGVVAIDGTDRAEWAKRMTWARENHQWSYTAWGALPHEPGCRVPADLLQPEDGKGWTEWKAA